MRATLPHMSKETDIKDILGYWFETVKEEDHFAKSDKIDSTIKSRFGQLVEVAHAGGLKDWLETANGTLAYILLIDQFSRNIYRGSPKTFAADGLARAAARHALEQSFDQAVPKEPHRQFFYLPFMHSEDLPDQERCVALYTREFGPNEWAIEHRDIIAKFGRFPHRNEVLGRDTTPDEQAYLDGGGFKG